ncbi:hypothetical protein F5Y11DRAFT_320931 [Daldinia sp. FL1419]|nr:hypothetical protein F5Y11DRAFT_320931 [Daldinia sp. FL1419]
MMGYPHFAPTLLWNLPLPSELGCDKPANIFAFSPDDKFLLTLHEKQGGILWDLSAASSPQKLEIGEKHRIKAATLDSNRGLLVVFGSDQPAEYYIISQDAKTLQLTNHVLPAAHDIKISRDGKIFAFMTQTTVELWDAKCFKKTKVLVSDDTIQNPFEKVALSQDSNYASIVDSEGRFIIWGLNDDFYKISRNKEVGVDLGEGWIATSIGLGEEGFAMATLRKRIASGRDLWAQISWGYKYDGPDNTLHYRECPGHALSCIAPSTAFSVSITPEGRLRGSDSMMCLLFSTKQGVSKKGKVVSCGISDSSKILSVARTNGRIAVWRLYTEDADPNERYPG